MIDFYNVRVREGQCVFDIAVQEYGSVDGGWLLLADNPDEVSELTDEPAAGTILNIRKEPVQIDDMKLLKYVRTADKVYTVYINSLDKILSKSSAQQVEDALSIDYKNQLNDILPIQGGQEASYASGDPGDLKIGRLADWFTLKTKNEFGNKYRFTGIGGGYSEWNYGTFRQPDGSPATREQAYPGNYAIDHATGLGWYIVKLTSGLTWYQSIAAAAAFSINVDGQVLDSFFLPSYKQYLDVFKMDGSTFLNFYPFDVSPSDYGLQTADTYWLDSTEFLYLSTRMTNSWGSTVSKSITSYSAYYARVHY